MADTPIDTLSITIQSNSETAAKGIDKLANALENLKGKINGVSGLSALAERLGSIGSATQAIPSNAAQKVQGLVTALQSLNDLNSIKISKTIGTGLSEINTAIAGMSGTGDTEKLQAVANGLMAFNEVKGGNIGSALKSLKELPEITKNLNSDNIRELKTQIEELTAVLEPLARQSNQIAAGFKALDGSVTKTSANVKSLGDAIKNTSKNTSLWNKSLGDLQVKVVAGFSAIKKTGTAILGFINSANEYIENVNLFQVAMGEYYDEAFKYSQLVSEKMGIDPSEWMRNEGVFMSMAKGFGLANEKAYQLSKGLTELAYDISSLYNEDVETSALRLQSAFAGEIEPLRRLGISISQATLQEFALSKGIKESISTMTEQEKAFLRSIKVMEDAGRIGAIGDFAKTLESPANAIRILKQEITQLTRAIGTLFIPILVKVLPYIQAFVLALTDIISVLASFVGFEMPEWDTKSWESGGAAASGALDDTTKSAKKLKDAVLGIDELNIISPDTGSGKDNDKGGVSSWINDLEIPEIWDSAMFDEIESKAQDLKDTMKDLLETYIIPIGTALWGWKIAKGLVPQLNTLKGLLGALAIGTGLSLIVKSIKTILDEGLTPEAILYGTAGGALIGGSIGAALAKRMGWSLGRGILTGAAIGIAATMLIESVISMVKNGVKLDNALIAAMSAAILGGRAGKAIFSKNPKLAGANGIGIGASIAAGLVLNFTQFEAVKSGQWSAFSVESAISTLLQSVMGGVAGFMLLGTTVGAGIGAAIALGLSIIMQLVAVELNRQASLMEEFYASPAGQEILQFKQDLDEISEINVDLQTRISSISTEVDPESMANLALAKDLVSEIFSIDGEKNLTSEQMTILQTNVETLNSLGLPDIQFALDETGHIANATAGEIQGIIEKLEEQYKLEAMKEAYIESYKNYYQAELNHKRAAQEVYDVEKQIKDTRQKINEVNQKIIDAQNELNSGTYISTERYNKLNKIISDGETDRATLNLQLNKLLEMQPGLQNNLNDTYDTLYDSSEAVDFITEEYYRLQGVSEETIATLPKHMQGMTYDMIKVLVDSDEDFVYGGGNLAKGVAEGIDENHSIVENAMKSLINAAKIAANKAADSHSPSKVFENEVGIWLPAGIAKGIEAGKGEVVAAMEDVVDSVVKVFNGVEYDMKIDYSDLIAEAAKAGDLAEAARLEIIRNAKIQGEGWEDRFAMTDDYQEIGKQLGFNINKGLKETISKISETAKVISDTVQKTLDKVEYDVEIDYSKLIDEAVANKDYEEAQRLELIRNAKIDGEGLGDRWAKTFDYQDLQQAIMDSTTAVSEEYAAMYEEIKENIAEEEELALDSMLNQQLQHSELVENMTLGYNSLAESSHNAIQSIINDLNNIPRQVTTTYTIITERINSNELSSVQQFALGGFPKHGSLFIADERGPELVGTIGGDTAVANNADIEAGIEEAAYRGFMRALSEQSQDDNQQPFVIQNEIYMDGRQLNAQLKRADRETGVDIMAGGVMA